MTGTIIGNRSWVVCRQVPEVKARHREVVVDDIITGLKQHTGVKTILTTCKYIEVVISVQVARTHFIGIIQHQAVRGIQKATIQTIHRGQIACRITQAQRIGARFIHKELIITITSIVYHIHITRTGHGQLTAFQDFTGAFTINITCRVNQLIITYDTRICIQIKSLNRRIPREATGKPNWILWQVQRRSNI